MIIYRVEYITQETARRLLRFAPIWSTPINSHLHIYQTTEYTVTLEQILSMVKNII